MHPALSAVASVLGDDKCLSYAAVVLWQYPQLSCGSTLCYPVAVPSVIPWQYPQLSCGSTLSYPVAVPSVILWQYCQLSCDSTLSYPVTVPSVIPWQYPQLSRDSTLSYPVAVPSVILWQYCLLSCDSTLSDPVTVPSVILWQHPQLSCDSTPRCSVTLPSVILWHYPQLSCDSTLTYPVTVLSVVLWQYPQLSCDSTLSYSVTVFSVILWQYPQFAINTHHTPAGYVYRAKIYHTLNHSDNMFYPESRLRHGVSPCVWGTCIRVFLLLRRVWQRKQYPVYTAYEISATERLLFRSPCFLCCFECKQSGEFLTACFHKNISTWIQIVDGGFGWIKRNDANVVCHSKYCDSF
jgi:hypothetical protein